jgi:hypothetical protein
MSANELWDVGDEEFEQKSHRRGSEAVARLARSSSSGWGAALRAAGARHTSKRSVPREKGLSLDLFRRRSPWCSRVIHKQTARSISGLVKLSALFADSPRVE